MKHNLIYILLLITSLFNLQAQKLSLTDLTNLCNQRNWEDVNQSLISKRFTYYESEKGNSNKYSTITWSFNKNSYSDKAEAWLYLYTYEDQPNKISYSVFNKESYSLIQNSIKSAGFNLTDSKILDNEIISTYGNSNYILKISTKKRTDNDWDTNSLTAYTITLIKKSGIYDSDNGLKTESYSNGQLYSEYNLINGKKHGPVKFLHRNGNLRKTGNYINGLENGVSKEFDEDGNLEVEVLVRDGKRDGILKSYENGKLTQSLTFKHDIKDGEHIKYFYNEETGKLELKNTSNYINDEIDGISKWIYIDENKERTINFETYVRGIKNGGFQEAKGDSLIIGNYANNKLDGTYSMYLDFNKWLLGGVIRTDTTKLSIIVKGSYKNDEKIGKWKHYDMLDSIIEEGEYINGEKSGEWRHYYGDLSDPKGGKVPYSKELYLVENYSNGKLEGPSKRYSFLNREEYPCIAEEHNNPPSEICSKIVYKKIYELSNYRNETLHGLYELRDSLNNIIHNGNYLNGMQDGEWLQRNNNPIPNSENNFIFERGKYVKDKRDGPWIQFYKEDKLEKSFNYKSGELDGEYIVWNEKNKLKEKKLFSNGKFAELITYDDSGSNPINKFEIYEKRPSGYKCNKTEYNKNGFVSQEFWITDEDNIEHEFFVWQFNNLYDETLKYKDGNFKLVESNNKPKVTGKYYKEDKIGIWSYYYYEQGVKIESNYTLFKPQDEKHLKLNGDLFSGEFVLNDSDKGVKEIRKIKDGLRHGRTTYVDLNTNKTIKKESYKNGVLK